MSHTKDPYLQAAHELVDAMVASAERLELKGVFLNLVVSALPDNPWLVGVKLSEEANQVVVRTLHLCPPSCQTANSRECITALKVEDMVSKRKAQPYWIDSLRAIDTEVEVRLRPFS